MAINNSKSQPNKSLIEFYSEAATDSDFITSEIGKTMIKWIQEIERKLPDLQIWGLTSHYRLVLMATETHTGDWSVILIGQEGHYRVDYLIPLDEAPWENAYITGETTTFDKAMEMTLVGIEKSGAWGKNIV